MAIKDAAHKTTKETLPPADRSGINTRAVLIFCAALVITAIVVHIVLLFLFRAYDERLKSKDPVLSPLTPKQQQLPPQPRLEASPNTLSVDKQLFDPRGLGTFNQQANDQLNNYGWVDDKNGIVRIPIQEAMKKVVEQAKQPQTTETQTNKTSNVQQ